MGLQLEDGKGRGFVAGVDSNNRLLTRSSTSTNEFAVSKIDGLAFVANTADTANTLTSTATGGEVIYLKNDSTKTLIVNNVSMSSGTAGGVVTFSKNMTLGTIGNHNVHVPVNINLGSGILSETTCYTWNETGDGLTGLTNGTIIETHMMGAMSMVTEFQGALVIPQGSSLTMGYYNTSGGEISFAIKFYFEDQDE